MLGLDRESTPMPTAPEGERNEPGKDEERVSILKLQPEKRKKGYVVG